MKECKKCGAQIEEGESCAKCNKDQAYIQDKNEESMFEFQPQRPTYDPPKKKEVLEPIEEETEERPTPAAPESIDEDDDPFLVDQPKGRKSQRRSKRKWLIAGLLLVVMSGAYLLYIQLTSNDTLYFTVNENAELGFVDETGELVLETGYNSNYPLYGIQLTSGIRGRGPEYMMESYYFTQPLFPAAKGEIGGDESYTFINQQGEQVFDETYEQAKAFHDGRALVVNDRARGYIDTDGEMVIATQYRGAKSFKDGYAPVVKNEKWGYINRSGDMVIEPLYREAFHFNEGVALVMQDDGRYHYIDSDGKKLIDDTFTKAYGFSEGLAPVQVDGRFGFINKKGTMKIEAQYEEAYPFHDDYATVCIDQKCGVINKGGDLVIEPTFRVIGWFVDGLAHAVAEGKSGYIDTEGNFEIELEGNYEHGFPFYKGTALTIKNVENPSRGDGIRYIFQYRNRDGEITHEFKPF